MSVTLSADGLSKRPSIEQFKNFLLRAVRKHLTKDCHELEFKQEAKNSLWVGCKSLWSRGCWFSFNDNGVSCITYSGRSPADMALQDVAVHELVKKYGGTVFDPQNYVIHKYDMRTKDWIYEKFNQFN
jgi:hypothetical protein